ncbi:hypothetical protein [Microbulbifer sp. ALW1]|uniref:hypothetical protein n=1 Tax=Microbulbifer sp. (strain ALW1) TaxID=1516059 RepID=UPI001F3ECAC0|nr:hypothetical protein [Microbulbifer sp. ALW1]
MFVFLSARIELVDRLIFSAGWGDTEFAQRAFTSGDYPATNEIAESYGYTGALDAFKSGAIHHQAFPHLPSDYGCLRDLAALR